METTYRLPAEITTALINDDYTGLSDDEHEQLEQWLELEKPGRPIMPEGEPFFAHGHAMNANQGADCYDVLFIKNDTAAP